MKIYLFFVIIFAFLFYGTANAAYYTWEDETGATHITNYPPPQIKSDKNIKVHKYDSDKSSENIDEAETAKAKEIKKPDVILYTKNNCADCDKARDFLKSKKIMFIEYNMDKDKESAAKRKAIDGSEDVPFAIINKNHVYGFTETIYNRALKITP